MKNFLFRAVAPCLVVLVASAKLPGIHSFVVSPKSTLFRSWMQPTDASEMRHGTSRDTTVLGLSSSSSSSTNTRPLYDGTNYTFPDTRTPSGVAELLEVSFIHACMQLASGYVDVLKLFIAACVGAYEAGFAVETLLEELERKDADINTANRPLMDEERSLRRDWVSVVYLALAAMAHAPPSPGAALAVDVAKQSVPEDVRERYGAFASAIGDAYPSRLSVDELMVRGDKGDTTRTPLETAILQQSLRVATLVPVVVDEAKEASPSGQDKPKEKPPPTPPIEGAF